MILDNLLQIRSSTRASDSLIHCITNPISINQCANVILAVGCRPIAAEHPLEVKEITKTSKALLLNLGNITDVRMESMKISAQTASKIGIPIVLDAVGVACSELRRKFAHEIIDSFSPTVIKGNYSETAALFDSSYTSSGVDSDRSLNIDYIQDISHILSEKYGGIILASGRCDIVTDREKSVLINNGSPQLSQLTGTGCMLGALTAAYLSESPDTAAAVLACAVQGICGELAQTPNGPGSFSAKLFDKLSTLSDKEFTENLKMEVIIH